MGEVIEINQKRLFTLEEAREFLPIVRRVTQFAHKEVQRLGAQLAYTRERAKKSEVEEKIQSIFQDWHSKVRKLGCEAKGMWLVDFDNGEGYYCWNYPEPSVEHFHGYFEGFGGRVKIH